ncbi:MAG: P44/Msp2 family outer membrane protein [Rickettsiales bacterium]|nr:P44/Msp2 family outer membrane protein [Rickettsiales bacterium]
MDQSNKLQSKYNPLSAANMAFGYSINSYRVELEGIYSVMTANNRGFEYDGRTSWKTEPVKKIKSESLIANVYYHWRSDRFSSSLYVGTGIGATNMKVLDEPSIWLAYQLKAGIDYHMHKYVSMRIGYRYFGATTISEVVTPSPISESNFSCNGALSTRGVEVGIIFNFASKTSSIV